MQAQPWLGDVQALEQLAQKFNELTAAAKQNKAEFGERESEEKFSIKKTRTMNYQQQLKEVENNTLNGSNSLYIGEPSAKLQSAGLSNAPFSMNQSDYRKSRRKAGKNKNYSSHDVPLEFFNNLPTKLKDTAIIIDNGEKVTLVTDYVMNDKKGTPALTIAGVWRDQSMEDDTVNHIKSIYPLDDTARQLAKAADNGKLCVLNKAKAENMLATIGVQSSEVSRILSLAKTTLSQFTDNVKQNSNLDGKKSKDDAFTVTDDGDLFFGEESGALDEVNPDDELGRTYGEIIEDEVNAGNSSRIDVRKLIDEYSPEQAVFMLYEAAMSTNERGVRGYSGIKLEDEDYMRAARRVMKRYGILQKNNKGFDAEFAQRIREFVEGVVNNPKSDFRTHISGLATDCVSYLERSGDYGRGELEDVAKTVFSVLRGKTLILTPFAESQILENFGGWRLKWRLLFIFGCCDFD